MSTTHHFILPAILFMMGACGTGEPPLRQLRMHIVTEEGTCPMGLTKDFQGVWTNPNAFSKVPEGAATAAENVVNPRPGVASCVAGQANLTDTYTDTDERFSSGVSYQGMLVESTSGATPRLYARDVNGPSLTAYSGSFEPPEDVERIPFAVAGEKLFMATSEGVKVLDGVASAPAAIGVPRSSTPFSAGAAPGTFLADGDSVAYRTTLVRKFADGTEYESAPSGRVAVTNTLGAPGSVTFSYFPPHDAVVGDVLRIWRTSSVTSPIDPGDIMSLAGEQALVAGDFTGLGALIVDDTPDVLRGRALYTNGTSEGISRQNDRPPYANVLAAFDDTLLLGNVRGPQEFTLRILAVPSNNDVLTIGGTAYTAKTGVAVPASGEFHVSGSGVVSVAIAETAQNLVYAINRATANTTLQADYMSGPNDAPGIIRIFADDVTTTAFTAQASANGERYEPDLVAAQSSLATTEPSGLWVSKKGQHYAFPPLRSAGTGATYRFRVGSKGNAILAMAPLREAVIVFVEKEGVFRVKRSGAESWRVDQINNNAHLLVPGSVAVVDNQVIALTTRGIVVVDEGGVEEIDLPIKDKVDEMKALPQEVLRPYTFAVADEARLRYILYTPTDQVDNVATHAWVYNADNGTWTERTDDASGGLVGEDDGLLYLGAADSKHLTRERVGTASDIYKRPDGTAIPVRIDWIVMEEGDAAAEKQYTELRLLTREHVTGSVTFACTNDLGGEESTVGYASGNVLGEPFMLAWVPDGCQRTSRLKVSVQRNVLGESFEVMGIKALVAGMYDGKMTR